LGFVSPEFNGEISAQKKKDAPHSLFYVQRERERTPTINLCHFLLKFPI